MSNETMLEKIKEARELKRFIEQLQDELSTIEDDLKQTMIAENKEKLIIGEYKLTYSTYEQTRVDSKKLKEEQENIYNQYSKTSTVWRFQIA